MLALNSRIDKFDTVTFSRHSQ